MITIQFEDIMNLQLWSNTQWKFGKQITSVISENPKIAKNFTALLKTYFRPMGPSKGPMT